MNCRRCTRLFCAFPGFEKQIHEHGFAAADPACQIDAVFAMTFGAAFAEPPKPAFAARACSSLAPNASSAAPLPLGGIVDELRRSQRRAS